MHLAVKSDFLACCFTSSISSWSICLCISLNEARDQRHGHSEWQLKPADETGGGADIGFEAAVVRRRSTATPAPALLFLHGGPHSAYIASYVSSVAYLAALGYVVIIVSPGHGTPLMTPGYAGGHSYQPSKDCTLITTEESLIVINSSYEALCIASDTIAVCCAAQLQGVHRVRRGQHPVAAGAGGHERCRRLHDSAAGSHRPRSPHMTVIVA